MKKLLNIIIALSVLFVFAPSCHKELPQEDNPSETAQSVLKMRVECKSYRIPEIKNIEGNTFVGTVSAEPGASIKSYEKGMVLTYKVQGVHEITITGKDMGSIKLNTLTGIHELDFSKL